MMCFVITGRRPGSCSCLRAAYVPIDSLTIRPYTSACRTSHASKQNL
jgi:hypothetical protein